MSYTVTQLPAPKDLFAAEVQYWRLDPACWRRVLERACEAGLPGISSYVPWEVHEVEKGRFDLDGATDPRRNVIGYLDLVKELGLKLAFRPGPFVCAEMDWGGHPCRIVTGDVPWKVLQADGQTAPGYHIARKEGHQPSYLHPAYLDGGVAPSGVHPPKAGWIEHALPQQISAEGTKRCGKIIEFRWTIFG